ncbi:MAG: InlB B-repeat-containing protein [Aeriscardovia sp.]|nr:InlB B-repeat-containing protein [Aeriscardovia sp.]
MKRLSRKLAAILLVAVMAVSLFPLSSLAETADGVGNEDLIVAEQQTTVENEVVADETTVEETTSEETAAEVTTPGVTTGEETVSGEEPAAETPVEETAPVEEPKEEAPVEVAAPVEEPVVIPENSITSQPQDALVAPNKKAVFEIETNGKVASYQWQYSANGGRYWKNLNSASYYKTNNQSSIVVTGYNSWFSSNNGYKYRCIVTFKDKKKSKVTSDVATLYVGGTLSVKSTKSKSASNAEVSVKAPEATFPAGTTLEVADVDSADYIDAINTVLEDTAAAEVTAVDISFKYDGEEVEPANDNKVTVTLKADAVKEGVKLVHIDDEGIATLVAEEDIVSIKNGEIVFKTDAFSVYAVVEPGQGGERARIALNFYNNFDPANPVLIKTIYVKNGDYDSEADEEEFKKIVFDPGSGTIPTGYSFLGWTEEEAYTATSARKTIEDIRTDIKALALADSIKEGDKIDYYAALYKVIDVTYLGDQDVALGTDVFLRTPRDPETLTYTVNMSYSPDATHNFEGWFASEGGNNIEGWTEGTIYPNETEITISGSVVFSVNAPEGQWLVFHENKGTYIAPQFVKSDEVTKAPTKTMERNGYTFDGWFADEACTQPFTFGQHIDERTHVYAGWTMKTVAPYMVICWTQNTNRTGYEVADSYVNENGQVGQLINYTFVNNGDEDYVTGVGESSSGTKVYDKGHYLGFCLREDCQNKQIEITPEGDAVLNLYFDRIEYNFKFYLYRDGTQNNRYDYANNSGNGSDLNGLVTWHSNQTAHPSVNGYTIQSETVGGRTYYYFAIQAYYGQDISSIWPTYDKITGANGREAVSYVMMVGTKLKPNPTNQGSGTVKGIITVMNENILGATNNKNGNYVMVRFPDSYYNWRYHIWFEAINGQVPEGKTAHEYNGKTYYAETVLTVRSSNTTDANQNEPKYTGFDYVTRLGQNNSGTTWQGGHWTTNEGGTTLYHLNYVYNRQMFKISYFDGNYVGDTSSGETTLYNRSGNLLHESPEIAFGAEIEDVYKNYEPDAPEGFAFEGWYLDEGCTVPYEWSTMPLDGITVFAKWHRLQYRAFLHPNADRDDTLDWGRDDQALNFRISYLESISLPFGTRTGYEFIGWFTESGAPYNEETKLTNDNTVPYDKTVDMTDPMDKWGDGATWNSDTQDSSGKPRNRFWITKKIDLYGRWRKVVEGAEGIGIQYDLNGGEGTVEDNTLYKDSANAYAQSGPSTPPANMHFDHWVLQTWNNESQQYEDTNIDVFPGDKFEVLRNDSKVEVTEWKSSKGKDAETISQSPAAIYSGADVDDITGPAGYPYISTATYTIQLKAVYIDNGIETPTYINWYQNEEGDAYATPLKEDKNLQINETAEIYDLTQNTSIKVKRGHVFLGWAKGTEVVDGKTITYYPNLGENDLLLKYDYDNSKYLAKDNTGKWVDALGVAADEMQPYEALYAVWKDVFYVVHGSDNSVEVVDLADAQERWTYTTGYDAENSKYTDYYYGGYGLIADTAQADPDVFTLKKGGTEATYSGTYEWKRTNAQKSADAFTASTDTSTASAKKLTVGDIFYIKEVPSSYLAAPKVATVVGDYGNGDITSITILSVIDTNIYRAGGCNDIKGTLSSSFTMTQNKGGSETTTAKKLFGLDGYLIINSWNTATGTYTLVPFWTTYDSVTVNSNSNREIVISEHEVQ